MGSERAEMHRETKNMQQQMNNMQHNMATKMKLQDQKISIVELENKNLKQNFNELSGKCDKVVNENQDLHDIVDDVVNITRNFSQTNIDFRLRDVNMTSIIGKDVEGNSKHNGSFISFSAYSSEIRNYDDGLTVLFDTVTTNVGSLYSPDTSIFLCGYEGYYMFTISIFTGYNYYMYVELLVDGTRALTVFSDDADAHTASDTVVVLCPQFSQVFVRAQYNGTTMFGDPYFSYSSFTGILLALV